MSDLELPILDESVEGLGELRAAGEEVLPLPFGPDLREAVLLPVVEFSFEVEEVDVESVGVGLRALRGDFPGLEADSRASALEGVVLDLVAVVDEGPVFVPLEVPAADSAGPGVFEGPLLGLVDVGGRPSALELG